MKKLIYFLIICAIGVVVFLAYIIAKKSQKTETPVETVVFKHQPTDNPPLSGVSIAYVDLDSLTANYSMTIDLANALEEKLRKLDAELSNRQRKFQANVTDFQNKANRGLETRARLAEIQEQLAIEEQNLMQLAERYRMEMGEEQAVMQRQILQSIMDFLQEYNKDKRYQFILGNAFDAKILYADPSLNITADVLRGLNASYKK